MTWQHGAVSLFTLSLSDIVLQFPLFSNISFGWFLVQTQALNAYTAAQGFKGFASMYNSGTNIFYTHKQPQLSNLTIRQRPG